MARNPYTIYAGDIDISPTETLSIQVVDYEGRVYILIDDLDLTLADHIPTIETGHTDGPPHVIKLQDSDNDDYDLDVTDPLKPSLTKK
ncbi:MAG: hypothetical protein DWQ02_00500 [Bacteroidetes bacterium]|nr:MAG: hypothetical protein DWQ02_00500 [Bacteroidota bacterium]